MHDIVSVEVLESHQLHITFDDGVSGIVNVAEIVQFEGVFAELADLEFFAKVSVSNNLGTICWPNGADLAPDMLYGKLTK